MKDSAVKSKLFRLYRLILLLVVALSGQQVSAQITAAIDSATITMGERTYVRVEVLKNGHGGQLIAPTNIDEKSHKEYLGNIEIRHKGVDSTDLGNNRIQVNYTYLIQPFKPDNYILPAFKYVFPNGSEIPDTFTSNPLALKVFEPEIPQEMLDSLQIHLERGPMTIEPKFFDSFPDWLVDYWYWWLAALLVLGALITLLILYKKGGKNILHRTKPLPPYELAMRRLKELKRKRLHEQGNNKAYYTELTDILRQYLGRRFSIYALEMTSTEILEALEENPQTSPFADELRPMFQVADFVKFAKQQSTTDENIRSYNCVEHFIEETRPGEEEQKQVKVASKKKHVKRKRKK